MNGTAVSSPTAGAMKDKPGIPAELLSDTPQQTNNLPTTKNEKPTNNRHEVHRLEEYPDQICGHESRAGQTHNG